MTTDADPVDAPYTEGQSVRRVAFALSLLLILAAVTLIPMPLVESSPGGVVPVPSLVAVDTATSPLTGQIGLLTVRIGRPSMLATVRAWLDDERMLQPQRSVIPPSLTQRSYISLEQEVFRRSFRTAAAIGLQAAGRPVEFTTAPQIVSVVTGSPADGVLQPGDLLSAFNGAAITSSDELVAAARDVTAGQRLRLTVRRGDRDLQATLTAAPVRGLDRPGMGISLQTVNADVQLPFAVTLTDQRGIGGPSAGMMMALTVYDLVADEDLLSGRFVVGTGTIDAMGRVGPIGAIGEKVFAAAAAGADVMLVPASQADVATRAAGQRLRIIGVNTFDDALAALRR